MTREADEPRFGKPERKGIEILDLGMIAIAKF
jgi:hypothetical protein